MTALLAVLSAVAADKKALDESPVWVLFNQSSVSRSHSHPHLTPLAPCVSASSLSPSFCPLSLYLEHLLQCSGHLGDHVTLDVNVM